MPSSSRRNKMALMEESGQTDAQRRKLRQKQRSLQKSIVDNGEAMEKATDETFGKIRNENNDLFQKVCYTREAVLDGENLDMIASRAAKQVDSLVQVPRYDALRLIQKLRQKCTAKQGGANAYFDWAMLGSETGTCYNAIPSRVQFLAGPLEADYVPKERKPRAKRQQQAESDDEEEERPEEVKNQETNADQLSAVERNIAAVRKTLRKRSRAAYKQCFDEIDELPEDEQSAAKKKRKPTAAEVCAVNYMFNPKSFTQTVENMFHYAFLVKKGEARMAVRDGRPKVAFVPDSDKPPPPAKQSVVSLNMRDWRRLCKAYEVNQSDIPNRTGSKQKHHHHSKKRAASKKSTSPDEDEEPPSP